MSFLFFLLLKIFIVVPETSPDLYGYFAASTPCSSELKTFLKIPAAEKCDQIKWKIYLYNRPGTQTPEKFRIVREFIYYVDNRTDKNMGTATIEGHWKVEQGQASGKAATILQLTSTDGSVIRFRKLDDNLLHLLNNQNYLMVGDAGYGYTFSRIKN
ncbi:hypothetical protein [Pollutibacter soli]|uniref:hypothetical protein n=1 Tax=Pollutibacter soli TaxID=3034157 RepID=UPI0030135255